LLDKGVVMTVNGVLLVDDPYIEATATRTEIMRARGYGDDGNDGNPTLIESAPINVEDSTLPKRQQRRYTEQYAAVRERPTSSPCKLPQHLSRLRPSSQCRSCADFYICRKCSSRSSLASSTPAYG
jgi:hypothetical protein